MTFQINGKAAKADQAYQHAAKILTDANLPLLGGLGTDIAGTKAALRLAEKARGVIDHLASDSTTPEMRLLSYTGGFTTTIGETRNRADLVMIVGKIPLIREPGLQKRIFTTGERLPHPGDDGRSLILLGGKADKPPSSIAVSQIDGTNIDIDVALSSLSAFVNENPVATATMENSLATNLRESAEKLKAAKFAVIVYSPSELSEPAIHCIRDLINTLNTKNRASALPITGRDNVYGANQACGWTTGYPLRTSFSRGVADHDPYLYETGRLLASGEADALLWISSFTKTAPPREADKVPQIVIGAPGLEFSKTPDVLIVVGEPGVDHDGAIYSPEHGAIVAAKSKGATNDSVISAASALNAISLLMSDGGDS